MPADSGQAPHHAGVIFDMDGVLVDSLRQHLAFCADVAREIGLDVSIPRPAMLRQWVLNGVKISPMERFFEALGFPPEAVAYGVERYRLKFEADYPVSLFVGVQKLLKSLHEDGLVLGLVTLNTRANAERALAKVSELFRPGAIYCKDAPLPDAPKAVLIAACAKAMGLTPEKVLYVGDQPSDFEAAKAAGVAFHGVGYGWGLKVGDTRFGVSSAVAALRQTLQRAWVNAGVTGGQDD